MVEDGGAAIHVTFRGRVQIASESFEAIELGGAPGVAIGEVRLKDGQNPSDYQAIAIRTTWTSLSLAYSGVYLNTHLGENGEYSFDAIPVGDWLIGFEEKATPSSPTLPRSLSSIIDSRIVKIESGKPVCVPLLSFTPSPNPEGMVVDLKSFPVQYKGEALVFGGGNPWIITKRISLPDVGKVQIPQIEGGDWRIVLVLAEEESMQDVWYYKGLEGSWEAGSRPIQVIQ